MDEMISTYGKGITVSAGLPYRKVRIRHLYTRRDSCRTAVDAVEAICIHIIRKT